jgi:uncharacterized membrane protein YtjA (UPF0391 family)
LNQAALRAREVVSFGKIPHCDKPPLAYLGPMLRWSLIFFVVAILAGLLGFWGIAGAAAAVAKMLFFIFAVIFLAMLLAGLFATRRL